MMLIGRTGIEKVLCIPFTRTFSEISPLEFVQQVLVERVKAKKIIVGYNYRFGKGKTGNVETLKNLCQLFNVDVEVVAALTIDGTIVSSSKIRELLKKGEVEKASTLLGKDYPVIGRVIEGARRGHLLGFPTANLEISDELYPKPGVYAVGVEWNDQLFNGVANIGFNPTFDSKTFSLEVFILDFSQDIYGDEIQISFIKRVRDEIRFSSPSDLIDQMKQDVEWAKDHVF
jgi:riboflavin kinase/FMN adenylyltransferase